MVDELSDDYCYFGPDDRQPYSDSLKFKFNYTKASTTEEIDKFLRNPPGSSGNIILAEPEVIEAWGRTSQFRRDQNMTAFAVRRKNWAMVKYGYPSIGAAVGLLAVGAILVKCRKRVTDSASNVKQSIQRCFGISETEAAEDQDHTANIPSAALGMTNADTPEDDAVKERSDRDEFNS